MPKFISPSDPAAQWTGAHKGPAFFAYATNYLIDVENAVIVDVESGRVVARSHNQRELLKDPTAHAEILAITQAADYYKSWRLTDCVLYVTLEPCLMCAGAIVQARIPEVVYGAVDPKAGAHCSVFEVLANSSNNHFPRVQGGMLADESAELLREFFRERRGGGGIRGESGSTNGSTG